MTLEAIRDALVSPMPDALPRVRMFSLLEQWVCRLRQLEVTGILWLDGSFVTRKPHPADIDCVFWPHSFAGPKSEASKIEVRSMTDRTLARASFGLDLYIEAPTPVELVSRQAYWRGMFGFQRDGKKAKGFVELDV